MGNKCMKSDPTRNIPPFTYQNMIKRITHTLVTQDYQLIQTIGIGSSATVYKARCIKTGIIRAIKRLDRIKNFRNQSMLLNQYDILKEMDHPNIMKIYQIYQQNNYYYIVCQLCPGQQLYTVLNNKKSFNQQQAANIFYQIISAVNYLHSKNIMHRDLKPENIIYDPTSTILKLIDFGTAIHYQTQALLQHRRVGTPYYIAPQVLNRNYNYKCDIWSLGIILFILLSGQPPFKGKNDQQVIDNIKKGQYNFKKPIWTNISSQSKHLISQMLTQSPHNRPQVHQLMQNDWFKKNIKHTQLCQLDHLSFSTILTNMQKFKQTKSNNLQGAIFIFIVNFIKNPENQIELQKCFKQLDLNGDGLLSLEEIKLGMEKFLKIPQRQAIAISQSIFKRIDTNNSGFIDYSEFIVAANNIQLTATQQNLGLAFDFIDQDKDGYISIEQIQSHLGDNISTLTYQQLLKQFQKNIDGQINKKNFVTTMKTIMKTF